MDIKNPGLNILCTLGSIAIHVEELLSPAGHAFDKVALETCLNNPDLKTWLKEMDKLALLPKKRGSE